MFSAQRPVINAYLYYASAIYSQDRVKSFLAPITLRLFHFNSLARWFHFDAVEVQMKAANFVNAFRGSHELRVALELCMTRDLDGKNRYWKCRINNDDRRTHVRVRPTYLKMIFLLTYECVVDVGKVETFIGVHSIMRHRPENSNVSLSNRF